ncbi:DUF4097 domain-containing protein [Halalkalibacterium halodurans]|uniref:DUF4097 family beta strand repeat-containing protein n=1 Tax=Halalkalibacterium halodurans TaxID=86665 RepID=UPI002E23B5F4|nr:DUF4097 domain-containing protein [Halalkalibacterium halodurans]
MKKIAGFILVFIGAVLFVHQITDALSFKRSESAEEITVQVDGKEELVVKVTAVDLRVYPTLDNEVTASLSENNENDYRLDVQERGNRIEIEMKEPRFHLFSFNFRAKPTLTVYVPYEEIERAEWHTVSGQVYIKGEHELDHLTIRTVSGDVFADSLKGNQFRFHSTSGDLEVQTLESLDTSMENVSGDVTIHDFSGDVNGKTVSGDISLHFDRKNEQVQLQTVSGDVYIRIPEPDAALSAESISGTIEVDGPFVNQSRQSRSFSGTIGSGQHEVYIKTTSGDIMIY